MTDNDKSNLLTEALLDRLKQFFGDNKPERISRNLRKVFFDYLRAQQAGLDIEFDMILTDIESVIELMDFAADEMKE